MESFFASCLDADRIENVLVVDDSSSSEDRAAMRSRYPGFRFLLKRPDESGHCRSMNAILDEVRTSRVLHIEDDWLFPHPFYLADILRILDLDDRIVQVLMCGRPGLRPQVASGGEVWLGYVYNPDHRLRTESLSAMEDRLLSMMGKKALDPGRPRSDHGWWWPGFSLNPGVFELDVLRERVGRFREDLPSGDFEADYALRVAHHPMGALVAVHDLGVRHAGSNVSAYVLNDRPRPQDIEKAPGPTQPGWHARLEQASRALERDDHAGVEEMLRLWNERPWRGEPLWEVVRHYHRCDAHAVVCLFAREGSRLALPAGEGTGVRPDIYEWRFLDMLCTHLYYIGEIEEGLRCFAALESREVPASEADRLESNRRFYLDAPGQR